MPSERNFHAICVYSASLATITMIRLHIAEIIVASIVSVLPVPVGVTTVATSLLVDQRPVSAERGRFDLYDLIRQCLSVQV